MATVPLLALHMDLCKYLFFLVAVSGMQLTMNIREVSLHVFNDVYVWKVRVATFEFLGC